MAVIGKATEGIEPVSLVSRLHAMAMRGLMRMYDAQHRLFVFRVRRTAHSVVFEGLSRRYTAITLIGLASEQGEQVKAVLRGQTAAQVCERLAGDIEQVTNLGDVALSLWASHAIGYADRQRLWTRLLALRPATGIHPVVELAWALDAVCVDLASDTTGLSEHLAQRLLTSVSPHAYVFPHMIGEGGARSHVSCFADMVYPIHALANFARVSGDRRALEVAAECAHHLCQTQGEAGQWWWHYDRRTGRVIEGYPVYAVHQDAMAPMALFALKEAGGPDFFAAIRRGLDWLEYAPEIQGSLIDERADWIWRKVARREPGKFSRYMQAALSRVHPSWRLPGLDAVFPASVIDDEDRPYHLGWLLYAWAGARAVTSEHRMGTP